MGVAAEVETGNASVVEVAEAAVEVGAEVGEEFVGVEDQVVLGPSCLSENSIGCSFRMFHQCRRSLCSFSYSYFSYLRVSRVSLPCIFQHRLPCRLG